jgi:hypothetical protein
MKNTLVVVTDLGGFKAFRLDDTQWQATPRLELVAEFRNPDAHERLVDSVTDLSGRFPRNGSGPKVARAMSDGERHNVQLEHRRRLIRQIARRLNPLLRSDEVERCFLAASREINHPLLAELEAGARARIARNIPADLTKVGKAELLGRFQPIPRLNTLNAVS